MSRAYLARGAVIAANVLLLGINGYLGYCVYRGTSSDVDQRLAGFSVTKYAIDDEELTVMEPPTVIWEQLDRKPDPPPRIEEPDPDEVLRTQFKHRWTLVLAQTDPHNPDANVGILVSKQNGQQVALAIGEHLEEYEVKRVEIVGSADGREARVTLQNGGPPVIFRMSRVP